MQNNNNYFNHQNYFSYFSVICGEFVRLFRCLNIHSKKTQSCIAKKWLIKNNDLIIKDI